MKPKAKFNVPISTKQWILKSYPTQPTNVMSRQTDAQDSLNQRGMGSIICNEVFEKLEVLNLAINLKFQAQNHKQQEENGNNKCQFFSHNEGFKLVPPISAFLVYLTRRHNLEFN